MKTLREKIEALTRFATAPDRVGVDQGGDDERLLNL